MERSGSVEAKARRVESIRAVVWGRGKGRGGERGTTFQSLSSGWVLADLAELQQHLSQCAGVGVEISRPVRRQMLQDQAGRCLGSEELEGAEGYPLDWRLLREHVGIVAVLQAPRNPPLDTESPVRAQGVEVVAYVGDVSLGKLESNEESIQAVELLKAGLAGTQVALTTSRQRRCGRWVTSRRKPSSPCSGELELGSPREEQS